MPHKQKISAEEKIKIVQMYLAENLLNRQFYASMPNEKWLTDVTEFKWYEGIEVHKAYLSAIIDLLHQLLQYTQSSA